EEAKHASGPWMKAVVDRAHPLLQHMRVDLRRRQIGVAKHHLNGSQIGTTFEQMGGERMLECVRAECRPHVRTPAIRFQNLPEADARESWSATARVYEQPRTAASAEEGGTCIPQIPAHPGCGFIAE